MRGRARERRQRSHVDVSLHEQDVPDTRAPVRPGRRHRHTTVGPVRHRAQIRCPAAEAPPRFPAAGDADPTCRAPRHGRIASRRPLPRRTPPRWGEEVSEKRGAPTASLQRRTGEPCTTLGRKVVPTPPPGDAPWGRHAQGRQQTQADQHHALCAREVPGAGGSGDRPGGGAGRPCVVGTECPCGQMAVLGVGGGDGAQRRVCGVSRTRSRRTASR